MVTFKGGLTEQADMITVSVYEPVFAIPNGFWIFDNQLSPVIAIGPGNQVSK